jgi:PAS domain S-box-containing protein
VEARAGGGGVGNLRPRAVAYVLVGLLLLSLIGLGYSAFRFEQNLEAVREAEGDNRAWNVSQLEVDYQGFVIALQDARDASRRADLERIAAADAALRLEFDIFYSRITAFAATLRHPDFGNAFREQLGHLLAFRDDIADRIDAMPRGDLEALDEVYAMAATLELGIRDLAVSTLQRHVSRAEEARLEEQRLFRSFLGQSVLLIFLVLASAILALRLAGLIRIQAQETLRAQALVNRAFEGAQEGVLVCDADGRILLSNPTARDIFGEGSGLEGRLLSETVVPPGRMRRFRMGMEALLAQATADGSGGLGPIQFEGLRADGEVFKASVALRAEAAADGTPQIFVFVRDITERIDFEERLRVALRDARDHSAAKDRFLATMSHEMRTPLHGVIASLDLLGGDDLDVEAGALVETARSCARRALAQIDFALDAIRSDGNVEPPTQFDPLAIVRSIITEMEPLARMEGNEISLDGGRLASSPTFLGQPKAYARTVFNLVGNAVKFTSGGRVSIRLFVREDPAAGQSELVTEVRDTGSGIPQADLERIFAPFEQSEASRKAAAYTGFGLGLAIVKQDVAQMRGRIEVESAPAAGACFRFTIPLVMDDEVQVAQPHHDGEDAPAPAALPAYASNSDALVVDDNAVNSVLVARMLEKLGYTARCCHSGAEAVEMARAHAYGLILMDVRMPGMDGVEATRLIRSGGASRGASIVGITAQVDFATSDAFRTSELTSVLTKPFGKLDLAHHLAEHAALPEEARVADGDGRRRVRRALRATFDLIGDDVGLALAADVFVTAQAAVAGARKGDPTVADKAHMAAGSALMMGLTDLGTLLQDLERMAAKPGAPEMRKRPELLAALSRELLTVESVLQDPPWNDGLDVATGIASKSAPSPR